MTKPLNDAQLEILRAAVCGSWYVDDENILDVADLIKRGYVTVESDYDCIHVRGTVKGRVFAIRRQLVRIDPENQFSNGLAYGPWSAPKKRRAA